MTTWKWTKVDDYHVKCNGYTIAKASVNGKILYTAFELPNNRLGTFESYKDAQNTAIQHSEKQSASISGKTK